MIFDDFKTFEVRIINIYMWALVLLIIWILLFS